MNADSILGRFLGLAVTLVAFAPLARAERVPGRYIVELTSEPVVEHVMMQSPGRPRLQSAMASAHRERLRAEQDQVRALLERRQVKVLDSVNTVANALFVDISDDAAAELAATPGVKRVIPVRTFHMVMDRAVLLTKAADAWNRVGSDNAGKGVKIAIIDSGVEVSHPSLNDPALVAPATFPRANRDLDLAYTNGKVIVARSYVSLLQNRDPDYTPRDHVGHGTALAMVAAGVRTAGPLATISGIAPKAYIGNYKVFGTPGYNDNATDSAILKAIDDAVADGMDVINLSLGDTLAPRLSDDVDVQAVERASKAGVLVVVAAGNNGPDYNTMSSPATAPSAIAVGASTNDRTFAASVDVPGLSQFVAVLGGGPSPSSPLTAQFFDVAALDKDGLACSPFSAGSLSGRIALILRGSCTFETKLTNAQRAGASAAVVYAAQESPNPIGMYVGTATIPAEMVSFAAGTAIKQTLASQPQLFGTLKFTLEAVPVTANLVSDFSAAGPNVDVSIKPDLMAPGTDIYTATETLDPNGDMYSPYGYVLVDGTSFSAPMVAGAAALLKSARPGLTVDQYRSLLINPAASMQTSGGQLVPVQQAGAGLLDVDASLRSTAVAYPVSLSFGAGPSDVQAGRTLTLTNVGAGTEQFTISAGSRDNGPLPSFETTTIELAPGASADIPVTWTVAGVDPGAYQGFITVSGSTSGTRLNIPYWYAATAAVPGHIAILDNIGSARRGSVQRDAILIRVTDAAGVVLPDANPQVSVVSGGGAVGRVSSYDSDVPGVFGIQVQLGINPGSNVFRIQAGDAVSEVTITGN